jgi:4-hydroxymandelate synthase
MNSPASPASDASAVAAVNERRASQARDIDHVEFYVGDARQMAFYLCTAFGFRVCGQGGPETGLTGQRSLLLRQGGVQILLTSALTADHPVAEYVSRHGDGVAVVAFGTADTEATYAASVAAGAVGVTEPRRYARDDARVVVATVSGFGDVVHRLVQRDGPRGEFLPGAIEMIVADPDTGDELLQVIDHAAVCLPAGELDPTVRYYEDVFGFTEIFTEYIEVGEQGMESRVVQSPSGEVTFTFLQPDLRRRAGQIDDFLTWHGGAGVQHVAFRTGDIVSAVRTFGSRGVGFAATPASYYDVVREWLTPQDVDVAALRELGVLVDRDHWGLMFQIFTQSMHVRRTLFFELIERHGARTFGTSNIKALYEAKERELAGVRQPTEAGGRP